MEQLKQIARPITHLNIVLLGAAVLFQGIDELGDQIKLAEVQNGIEILAEKPIEAREVLPVNRVTVNAGRDVGDVRRQISIVVELSVLGRAPRRRASLVEEDSTQRVVD
jgi:hypothetical protein